MNKAKYITNPYIYLLMVLLPLISSIIVLCFKEFYGAIVCFIIAILFSIPIILLRKKFFSKMLIDEEGIKIFYKNKLIKQIVWNKIKEAQASTTPHGGQITFTENCFYTGKEKWKNWNFIFVNLNSDFAIELYKYSSKIPVKIKDLDKLPIEIQNKFK